jgi:DNA polymerase theta
MRVFSQKLRYAFRRSTGDLLLVGMSATLKNIADISEWLKATLYESTYRPVPLSPYIKFKKSILYSDCSSSFRDLKSDSTFELVVEVVHDNNAQCLIFCSSKKYCETFAEGYVNYVNSNSLNLKLQENKIELLKARLMKLSGGALFDKSLMKIISYGIAYHHAGMTIEERGKRDFQNSLLSCTHT